MKVDVHDPEVLLASVEGELSAADRAAVGAALRDEPALRSLVEAMRDDRAALRAWPREDAPAGLSDQAVRRLERLERESLLGAAADAGAPDRRWRIGPVLVYSGLAAALALAAAVLFQTLGGGGSTAERGVAYEVAEAEPSEGVRSEPGPRREQGANEDRVNSDASGVGADAPKDAAPVAEDLASVDELVFGGELMERADRQMAEVEPDADARLGVARPGSSTPRQITEAETDTDTLDRYMMQRAGERPAAPATPGPAAETVPPPADREQAAAGPLPAEATASPPAAKARYRETPGDPKEPAPSGAALNDSAAPRFDLSTLLGPLPWQVHGIEPRDRGTVTDQPVRAPLRPAAPVVPPSD